LPACLEIMLATGDLDQARSARDELRELAEAFDTDVLRAVVAQADGAIAIAERHSNAALDPLRRAFDLWQRSGAPYDSARSRVLIARACNDLGDLGSARVELDAAGAVFSELGAAPDLAALGHLRDQPAAPSPGRLTPREREVLRLIAGGGTNTAIAGELRLSERTVDRHVSNILTKLGVPSRAAAIAFAYDHRLI
jgi:DNA-binding CsgD family transcriptional regulator